MVANNIIMSMMINIKKYRIILFLSIIFLFASCREGPARIEIAHIVLTVIFGFLLFELIEHFIIPVIFYVRKRKQQSVTGIESMPGELVDIHQWDGQEGQVFVRGEMWKAVSEVSFTKGDKAVIQQVEGLTLKVQPISKAIYE